MTQELIYTSAPKGLKPGSRGFCTVQSSQGMAKNLADQLEALSGYRHVYPPQDAQAALNPVAYSHLKLTVGGRPLNVLSRIADAGLDYTQRTNKFAHHVVLDTAECGPGGPAALLASPWIKTDWDGQPRILPPRQPPVERVPPAACAAWKAATGDAGWGGALASTAIGDESRVAVLVYRPGMNMLPLLAESLALLPPEKRWNVTFSTYFTRLPPGVVCQWRCVLEGTPEALTAMRTPQALVINLCQPLGSPPASPLLEAARTGRVPLALWPTTDPAAPPSLGPQPLLPGTVAPRR